MRVERWREGEILIRVAPDAKPDDIWNTDKSYTMPDAQAKTLADAIYASLDDTVSIALRDALLAKYPVERWEPVSEEYTDEWRCQVKPIDNYLRIYNEVTGGWEAVELPPTIRLCRLVEGE